ncbi:MAG: hypothetical protein QM682_01405 [Paracoccus sp. (in: a-proteobacteria)]|uniref:hypothetical protein n=1 Tax=Paracoccus sp. TaxID=267 RepID=UPI0039E6E1EF
MKQIGIQDRNHGIKTAQATGARRLIEDSLSAPTRLMGAAHGEAIPPVAESPIPLLDARNRTPDPLKRHDEMRQKAVS